jgi:hypothetical protein
MVVGSAAILPDKGAVARCGGKEPVHDSYRRGALLVYRVTGGEAQCCGSWKANSTLQIGSCYDDCNILMALDGSAGG